MRLMIEILTIYAIYIFGTSLLIWRYGTKDRGPLIVVAAVIPILTIVSFFEVCIRALFLRSPQMSPCPDGLAEAERIIERHRHEMFGGSPIPPHIAHEWEMFYAKTLEREAARVQRFATQILHPA
jgi:hypothetical protein